MVVTECSALIYQPRNRPKIELFPTHEVGVGKLRWVSYATSGSTFDHYVYASRAYFKSLADNFVFQLTDLPLSSSSAEKG